MAKELVSDYWISSSDSSESTLYENRFDDNSNEIIVGLEPESGEKYRNCIDIVMKSRKMQGTIRMALNPTLEDILTDFFETLEEWQRNEGSFRRYDGCQLRGRSLNKSKRR